MNPCGDNPVFATTHWSVVLMAGSAGSTSAEAGLSALCRTYWFPLYAFARRLGHSPPDAQDLTQGFFARLVETRLVSKADAEKGRFRSFLLGAFKHFISHERQRAAAQRRGGGETPLSLDALEAEALFSRDLATHLTPDAQFDRSWAMAVLEEASQIMEAEFKETGRGPLFEKLFPCVQGDSGTQSYAEIAAALGTTEGTIKVTVSRMRQRYREVLGSVVSQTVASPAEVEDELRELTAALRR
jgi:RNA polymerase sigma-70 factor (ECF subfamily)